MNKLELNILVEKLIYIRDNHDLSFEDKETLATACNVIYKNINKISEED